MRLQEISYALRAVADVAHAGEQLAGSVERTRARGYFGPALKATGDVAHAGELLFGSLAGSRSRSFALPVLLGVGVGVGIGALLFSESARERVSNWLFGTRVVARPGGGESVSPTTDAAGSNVDSTPATH